MTDNKFGEKVPFFDRVMCMLRMKKVLTYLVIAVLALLSALNYELFVFPNQFAPAGLNGLCTMFQHVTGLSMGYLNLLLNLPLAVAVYFKVSRSLSLRAMCYVLCFSGALLLLDHVDLSAFAYATESGTSTIMGPLVGGIISGTVQAALLRASAYTGGTDFISSLIHKYRPDMNFFFITFSLNAVVAVISFFIYGYKIEPVLMCILYSFASSMVVDRMNKSDRSAIRFEIITDRPEELSHAIIEQLHHSATLVPAKGMYKGQETNILICIVNKTQSAALSALLRSYPGTFAVSSQVSEVVGNFKRLNNRGNLEPELFDQGDGTGIS